MTELPLATWMFPVLFIFVFAGLPVSLSLISVSAIFSVMVYGEIAGLQLYRFVGSTASTYVLAAVPLFIFMGAVLERSGIASRLFAVMRAWLGWLPGGMGLATIAMCAVFAASAGVVGAVEVMVGLLAVPVLLQEGYKRSLVSGVICAGGSLGTMIPPSIVVIIYASIAQLSVGTLFGAILLPGLLMVVLFLAYVFLRGLLDQDQLQERKEQSDEDEQPLNLLASLAALVPPLLLVTAVIGSIMLGIAAVTEAAAVGAAGAVLLNALYGEFDWRILWAAAKRTMSLTSMILFIVLGGTMFTSVFRLNDGSELVSSIVESLPLSDSGLVLLFLLIVFVLGAVLDWVSVVLVTVPIFLPFLTAASVDPIWFAVLTIIVIQTSYLTPPMAPSVFYFKGIAPKGFTYGDMYRGVLPFVACQIIVLLVVFFVPEAATSIPDYLKAISQ